MIKVEVKVIQFFTLGIFDAMVSETMKYYVDGTLIIAFNFNLMDFASAHQTRSTRQV